ncbi:MAG: bifunctional diguanylate cyclase/phosphodiesterase [Rhodospirillales bacterium]|nr:bifunctional diguanylate cyclase/phosphodiesterase [Rhodospirillales bacterium]
MALDQAVSSPVFAPDIDRADAAASLLAALDGPALLLERDHRVGLMTREAGRLLALDPALPVEGAALTDLLDRSELAQASRAALGRLAQTEGMASALVEGPEGEVSVRRVALPGRRVALLLQAERPAPAAPTRDALTGLADRPGFRDALASRLGPGGTPGFGLLLLDIDRFRLVNETLGPGVGDQLLAIVAARLRQALRGSDLPGRLGGDEFAVLVGEDAAPEQLDGLARRLMDVLGRPYLIGGHPVTVQFSAGIARAPEDGTDADTLLARAAMALHAAKEAGRGRCAAYVPEMLARSETRRRMEADLRRAHALRQFDLHYQPQIDVTRDRLFGFEALLRWRHPSLGPVPPASFIPLAEEIGLIAPIGEWVLGEACREAATWPEPLSVAVNVSALQFEQGDLLGAVRAALGRSGLPAGRLEIEVTESALLGHPDTTLAILRQLRAMGVRIAMDDFGTGYSSLTRLQSFPFDRIKIDRSFVSGTRGFAEGRAIVRAIAGLGASLGMRTIAEGVETDAQFEWVRAEGCTEVQGYLFGRPVPSAEIAGVLARYAAPAP